MKIAESAKIACLAKNAFLAKIAIVAKIAKGAKLAIPKNLQNKPVIRSNCLPAKSVSPQFSTNFVKKM
ncbi:MAG: hypothetical protein ACI31F_00920 [Muribaculaceae bacterium]